MKHLISILLLLITGLGLNAQSLTIDSSFQPFFDIRNSKRDIGVTSDLWENPKNGKIYIVGGFEFVSNKQGHYGITSMNRNGSKNLVFQGMSGAVSWTNISNPFDTFLVLTQQGNYLMIDSTGNWVNSNWRFNYRKTVSCVTTVRPYFYKDGSSLMSNSTNNWGVPCPIYNPPDTFPGRYIIKVNPQGLWDSSFVKDSNWPPTGFISYDSNRLFVYGLARDFTHYDGHRVNGLCRIYEDGRLDTTFQLVLSDTADWGSFKIQNIQADGKFFLAGNFFLNNYPLRRFTLARFNPDGTLDSTFNNFNGPRSTNPLASTGMEIVNAVCQTTDGGYLVGGLFNIYQGYYKHSLAKIDSLGNVEPQYFTGRGPDSAITLFVKGQDTLGGPISIVKSQFGGYYVMGDFFTWDGAPVQGIVRITDITTGIKETRIQANSLQIYPNPTKEKLLLNSSSALIQEIKVFDILGQQLIHQKLSPTHQYKINLAGLEGGIYFINVKLGESWVSKKVVKR